MTAVIQMRPEGRYADPELERLANEMHDYILRSEVMHVKAAAAFLGINERTIHRIPDLPSHKIHGLGRVFLRSELIEYIKKH